jgi:hypothetical protein
MARITCKTPSTGRPVNIVSSLITTGWTTLTAAPDFSVPDTSKIYSQRDTDTSRGIRPGEIFFLTPVFARNISETQDCWVEVRILDEAGAAYECPGKMLVPAGDTALIPVQGRSLLKRNALSSTGDRLQIRAEVANLIHVWASAEEKPSAEHIGVV